MDTALITFMIQTSTSTQSVHLIGSWDNFTKHYPMERDIRRSRGQWRGCYAFEDIICDGEGGSSPKRSGGLKMGSTYYYYYELDDGTEIHDMTLPFTTSCPYLPGQPVNLLWVPIEVQPLRYRSASMSSMANGDIKTMNPADKFMTPRPPPPTPAPAPSRLNTSPSVLLKKRSARSVSPKSEKAPWSPRMFFGLRTSAPTPLDSDKRGRSSSLTKMAEREASIGYSALLNRSDEIRKVKSVPHTRDVSPQSVKKAHSREPSPLRQVIPQESSTMLVIPDEITEEAEDDDNFASPLNRASLNERGLLTQLSPPPSSGIRSPAVRIRSGTDTSKPLPQLPEETLVPPPLRFRLAVSESELPRSHFSTSTISTTITSPTDSHFAFSETPSISDSNDDDDDLAADTGSGDEFAYSPNLADRDWRGFSGYSLPNGEYASEQTIRKETTHSQLTQTASRATFGAPTLTLTSPAHDVSNMTALEELLNEMGYLGDAIVGK